MNIASSTRMLKIAWLVLLTLAIGEGMLTAQISPDTIATTPASVQDTIQYSEVLPDSMRNFCGCESVESVKKCADCFQSSGPVLRAGYNMSFVSKTVVQGSCWGFVDAVYKKAGVNKETIFSSKQGGPYASADKLKPGDWIYHVNYSYRNVGHSAIFVCWKDKAKKQAITMSYVGMNRTVPGRLDVADLKGVFSIFRAK
jgi:hypothetical protein